MKRILLFLFLPNITFAGGSGIAHIHPALLFIPVVFLAIIVGFVFYLFYWIVTYNTRSSRRNWYKERDIITNAIKEQGYQMVFSDMKLGTILYKKGNQKLEINKHQNQWFIKGEKEELKAKEIYKAYKNIKELNLALLGFIK